MGYYAIAPDLVIVFGFRAPLSLLGLIIMFVALWKMEFRWDEEGRAAYEKAQNGTTATAQEVDDKYRTMEDAKIPPQLITGDEPMPVKIKEVTHTETQSRSIIRVSSKDARHDNVVYDQDGLPVLNDQSGSSVSSKYSQVTNTVLIPEQSLKDAMPIPNQLLGGSFLWALSFLLAPDGSFKFYANTWNIFAMVLIPAICMVIAFPIRLATIHRSLIIKKQYMALVLLLGWFLALCVILDKETDAPWYFSLCGMLFIFASYHPTRRARKMGNTWEIAGTPNYQVSGQHLGTLFLVFGLFLFWAATNCVNMADYESRYIPFYLQYRAWLVFLAGIFIIYPSTLALDYAFEQGSEPNDGYAPGLNGKTFLEYFREGPPCCQMSIFKIFATVVETPLFFLLGWFLFAFCAWMPFEGYTHQKLAACLSAVIGGVTTALLIFPAYWAADFDDFKRWTVVYSVAMLSLALSIGVQGRAPLIMGVLGVIAMLVGQRFDMIHRGRGIGWVRDKLNNPHITAFNSGQPAIVVGWILLCLAMAVPM